VSLTIWKGNIMWKKIVLTCLLAVGFFAMAAPASAGYRYWGPRAYYGRPYYYGPGYYGAYRSPYYGGVYGGYGGYGGGYAPYGYAYPTPYYAPYNSYYYGGPFVGVYGTTYYY
jgi:hypothetical protein